MFFRKLQLKTKQGMTLTEILVTLSIIVIVMVAVGTFQFNILSYNRSTQIRLTNIQEANNLLKVMSREFRASASSANGSFAILSAATSSITFYADVDSDGLTDQVRYYLASTTLYRGLTKPTGSPAVYNMAQESKRVVATGIANSSTTPVFEYFLSTYNGTTPAMTYPLVLTSIRLIKINLVIDSDLNKPPPAKTFSTQVSLRNLKDNL